MPLDKWDIGIKRQTASPPLSLANPDLKMMQSNLLILLLLNLAFAAALDNVPEEETNRVHRRGPLSSAASEKLHQFMEECDGDLACVRGKMRDWRKAKKAGEASLDRFGFAAQFAKECNYDMACIRRVWEQLSLTGLGLDRGAPVAQFLKERNYDMACTRRKMEYWNLTGLSGSSIPVGGMGASYGRSARQHELSTRDDSEKLAQLLEELMEEFKMTDWSKTKESGEPSLDRRVHQREPSSSDKFEKRTQFMEECGGGDGACIRGKMREWRKAKKAGEASF